MVRNSLVENDSLVPLMVRDPSRITWYTCGPTVYDASHLGHARSFVTVDILQRVLVDYFGYSLDSVMNITDVDDKILNRAKETQRHPSALALQWERDFHQDMRSLGVRPPTRLMHVTDYINEIISMTVEILNNGHAYESNGSVYYDVKSMLDRSSHARLMPSRLQQIVDHVVPEDDEFIERNEDKRNIYDFALWKRSDESDVLSWASPFGAGRPGWHIECSAMARAAFGMSLDVHCGGVDLCFPHHENEILQCEAVSIGNAQWPNYFLHIGHLRVHGAKMSKSLKNFITIKKFLETNTADELRWFCLLNRYDGPVEWSQDRAVDAQSYQDRVRDFLAAADRCVASAHNFASASDDVDTLRSSRVWSNTDVGVLALITDTKRDVDRHLRRNFDTAKAVAELMEMISAVSLYMKHCSYGGITLVSEAARYVRKILQTFGLREFDAARLGIDDDDERVTKLIDDVVAVRNRLRVLSSNRAMNADDRKQLFDICDHIRDDILVNAGVKLSDTGSQSSEWRFSSRSTASAADKSK